MLYDATTSISLPTIKPRGSDRSILFHSFIKKVVPVLYSETTLYLVGFMSANVINFLFTILLGRFLTLTDFGIFSVVNAVSYIGGIILGALSSTITHRVSYLLGKGKTNEASSFFVVTRSFAFKAGIIYIVLWLIFLIPLSHFFRITSYLPILCLLPVLPCGFINSTNRGYLSGNLLLKDVGLLTFIETLIKFVSAMIFVYVGFSSLAYISLPISSIMIVLLSLAITAKKTPTSTLPKVKTYFPRKFFLASLAVGCSTTAFLAVDVLVVKHYMSSVLAGQYALLAVMGKIIYFCGSLFTVLIIGFVSREEGAGKKSRSIFPILFISSLLLTSIPYVAIGIFGKWIAPILLGKKAIVVLPYLALYAIAIALFTISLQIVSYYLAKKQYMFTYITLFCYLLLIVGISFFHTTIWDLVYVVLVVSITELLLILFMHFFKKNNYDKK